MQLQANIGSNAHTCINYAASYRCCSAHCLDCAPDQPNTSTHVVVRTLHHALKQRHAWSLAYMLSGDSRVWPAAATIRQTASFALQSKSRDAKGRGMHCCNWLTWLRGVQFLLADCAQRAHKGQHGITRQSSTAGVDALNGSHACKIEGKAF